MTTTATTASTAPGEAKFVPEKLHLQTLLVPTDFSESSRKALRYAVRLGQQFGSAVLLLHVIEPLYPYPVDGLMHYPGDLQDPKTVLRPEVEKSLTRLGDETAREGGVPVRAITRVGRASDEIADVAGQENADLIIISTHGYTGLTHVLMGSVAERVVRHAPCPVLVVRERERDFVEPGATGKERSES